MEHTSSTDKRKTVQLSDGLTVIVHYAQDKPSLQETMIKILGKYQIKSAKI